MRVERATSSGIRIRLTCRPDSSLPGQGLIPYTPELYDIPLTLSTRAPSQWKVCSVTQGRKKAEARSENGSIRYDAIPGGDVIVITPLRGRR